MERMGERAGRTALVSGSEVPVTSTQKCPVYPTTGGDRRNTSKEHSRADGPLLPRLKKLVGGNCRRHLEAEILGSLCTGEL